VDTIGEFLKTVIFSVLAIFGTNLGTEEPRYQVVAVLDPNTEIRLYAPRLAAEITVTRADDKKLDSVAFGRLAAFIFGENTANTKLAMTAPVEKSDPAPKTKIAMTAPVEMKGDQQSMTMRFFMPSHLTADTVPRPKDPAIKLITLPEQHVAVRTYSGAADEIMIRNQQEQLKSALAATSWKLSGDFRSYFYNPPWTLPFLRRNEITINVTR
jgi:hypothetical protein